jgi:2-amino-4-hydroxy-6-hydroxymethyldihydropteridine diphosphokinase
MKPSVSGSHRALIGLGTNLGRRLGNIRSAVAALSQAPGIELSGLSPLYETEPVGLTGQPKFLNAAALIGTTLGPQELLACLQGIEAGMGRKRGVKWGPRIIDLDILFYDQLVLHRPELEIPHPEAAKRAFVLVPVLDLCPEMVDPSSGKPLREILSGLDLQGQGMKKINNSRY